MSAPDQKKIAEMSQIEQIEAAFQDAADRLMPVQAREREQEDQRRRLAAALNEDATFTASDLSRVSRDSVLTAAQIAAITLGINHSHPCAQLAWARVNQGFTTGNAAVLLEKLVQRADRLAVHFKVQPTDPLPVDDAMDFAAERTPPWIVPATLTNRVAAEEVAAAANDAITHSTKERRNVMTPVIEKAQELCRSTTDVSLIWPQIQKLAKENFSALRGEDEDGVKYVDDDVPKHFTKKNLSDRLRPKKLRAKPQ